MFKVLSLLALFESSQDWFSYSGRSQSNGANRHLEQVSLPTDVPYSSHLQNWSPAWLNWCYGACELSLKGAYFQELSAIMVAIYW